MSYQDTAKTKMNKVVERFIHDLNNVRTGRANPTLLDDVHIDYYGTSTPLNQLAQIAVVEGTQLMIKAFDLNSLKDMEKAINMSGLNLPVQNDGNCLRINLPKLTEDRRKELVKDIQKMAEDAKVQIRNIRREINDNIKKAEDLPEDLERDQLEKTQKLTDEFAKKIEDITKEKAAEITTI